MSPVSLIPALQSDALVREIARQLADENRAIADGAKRDAHGVMAQARAATRRQVHDAIEKLREEGARRLTRAKAQLETEARGRAQRQAAAAVREALPLLQAALEARWRAQDERRRWIAAVAQLCADRLPRGAWRCAHPRDFSAQEQKQFAAAVGDGAQMTFETGDMAAGLRVGADQALLDATPQGLLADKIAIAAMLLEEIGAAS